MTKNKIMLRSFIFLFVLQFSQAQLRYSSVANTSTMTTSGTDFQMTTQSKSNVAIAFKRGSGTTVADREIKVAYSTNAGQTFSESDITIPTNTNTSNPIIASAPSSIVVFYRFDSSGTSKVCLARSTNSGSNFTLTSFSNSNLQSLLNYVPSYGAFISDGTSKYYIGDEDYLFASTDNGASFKEMKIPTDMNSASYARWAATPNYLWVVYNKSAGDSIYVYRSGDNGNTYQKITQYYVDFYSNSFFSCFAVSDQLFITWVHEEVGTYSLRMKSITGTTVGTTKDVFVSTSGIYSQPIIKKSSGRIFIKISDGIFQSTDAGNNWSRSSDATTEIPNYPSLYMFIPVDDTTIYLHTNNSSTGSLRQNKLSNWKWTDFPIPRIKDDTLITTHSYFYTSWDYYVSTKLYRFQMSKNSNFSTIELDTVDDYSVDIELRNRFAADGTRYYYRIRGEEDGYSTQWSITRSFRFGSIMTNAPILTAPVNGSTINYPSLVNFQWNSLQNATRYIFHQSTNVSFTDSISYYDYISDTKTTAFPFKDGKFINGITYWRIKGIEYSTGSSSPWSATGNYNYAGAPTSVVEQPSVIPTNYFLYQNYPNPFNPTTTIQFGLPNRSTIKLQIINTLGQVIETLVDEQKDAGYYNINWNAANISSGIYFYRVVAINVNENNHRFVKTGKMILMK